MIQSNPEIVDFSADDFIKDIHAMVNRWSHEDN